MKKSKFNILFEEIMQSLYKQGGAAMAHFLQGDELQRLTKIKIENVQPTLNYIAKNILQPMGIDKTMWTGKLGSTGKKDLSGDMDIAIRMDLLGKKLGLDSIEAVKQYLLNKLIEFGYSARRVMLNIHFACPIQGTQNDGSLVQIDFFNSVDLDYTQHQKFSPAQNESKYKGFHRSEFWRTVMKSCSMAAAQNTNTVGDFIAPDGRHYPAKEFQHILMMDDGFWMASKSWLKKNGDFAKTERKDIVPRKFLGRDFQVILDMIFGKDKYHFSDLNSFESIWNNIVMSPDFPYKDRIGDIVTTFYYSCKNQREPVVIPVEVQDYIKKYGIAY